MSKFTEAIENIYYSKEMQKNAEHQLKELIKNGYVVSQQEYNDFYWDTNISVSLVNQFKTMKPDPIPVKVKCSKCNQTKVESVQSRCKLLEIESSKTAKNKHNNYICSACRVELYKPIKLCIEVSSKPKELKSDNKYMDYKEYLQTEHWKETRYKALRKANFRCELCNSNNKLHVHHKTYENRGKELPQDLICLCEGCHSKFHNKVGQEVCNV